MKELVMLAWKWKYLRNIIVALKWVKGNMPCEKKVSMFVLPESLAQCLTDSAFRTHIEELGAMGISWRVSDFNLMRKKNS